MLSTINDAGTDGTTKTSIMYKSFLSYAQLKEYLSFTLEKGLVGEFPQKIETRLVIIKTSIEAKPRVHSGRFDSFLFR